ncbi:hypothetical protein BH09BAC4_BH09BAC4_16860 [soil metagenome]
MSDYINRKKFPFKLLVEGKDDLFVTANIRDVHQVPDNFEIIDCEGVEKMPDQIIARIKLQRPTIDIIGIILDADQDLLARWNSLKGTLEKEGYEVPPSPDVNGTVITGVERNPNIGIWLMPDNATEPGMLENFVELLIPDNDDLHPKVLQILSKIESEDLNRYALIHHKKALIHTWLAWQEEPGKPMGTAIAATYLDHNSELCLRFVNWLNRLFNVQ